MTSVPNPVTSYPWNIKVSYLKAICHPVALCVSVTQSCLILFDPIARQTPLSLGCSRQEYWSGLPFPSPGHLPDPGKELTPPALAGGFLTTAPPGRLIIPPLRGRPLGDRQHCIFVTSLQTLRRSSFKYYPESGK